MREILIRVKNPSRKSDSNCFERNFEITIDGKPITQVKRFMIDLDDEKIKNSHKDISYTLEKYLDIHEVYYEDSDTMKSEDELMEMVSE